MGQASEQVTRLLSGVTANGSGEAFTVTRGSPDRVYQASISGTGAVSATCTFEGSCDGVVWSPIATGLALTGSGSDVKAVAVTGAPWPQVRATIASISGTGATVNAFMAI